MSLVSTTMVTRMKALDLLAWLGPGLGLWPKRFVRNGRWICANCLACKLGSPANFRRQRGFTLIEIMAALVVFAVGMISVISMQVQSIRQNAFSNRVGIATTLAQDKMESLRWKFQNFFSANYLTLPSECPPPGNPSCIGVPAACTEQPPLAFQGYNYTRCWTVSDPVAPPFDLNVYVNWDDKPGVTRNINVMTKYDPR